MSEFFRSTKLKAIIFPLVILILISALLITHVLKQEQRQPSKGWSRAIYLKSTLQADSNPFINYGKNNSYRIFTVASKDQVGELDLNSKLEATRSYNHQVSIPERSPFWTDGQQFSFIKNDNLVTYKAGKTDVVMQKVDGMVTEDNKVYLWKSNKVLSYNPVTKAVTTIATTPYAIDGIYVKKGTDTLLVQSKVVENKQIYLGVLTKKGTYTYHTIDTINAPYNASIGDFDFVSHDNVMYVVYTEYGSTTGGMYRKNYLATYDLTTFKKKTSTETLNIINSQSQLTFPQPTNVKVNWKDNQLALLFQETGTLLRGEEAQNIFLAKRDQSTKQWTAFPVTSTLEPSASPLWLTNNTILWNDLNNGKYQVLLASQDPQVIQKGSQLIQKDWSNAISRTLINLAVSLLMIGYALMWAVPTGIFIIVMFFGNMTLMERNPRWVSITGVLVYLVTQLLTIKGLFGPVFSKYAPQFLVFPGNYFVIPVVLVGISWLMTQFVRNEEWGNAMFIFYCLLLDALMLGFLIGPYTL
jgi:hypothetical protein